jgi:hypothetical protein
MVFSSFIMERHLLMIDNMYCSTLSKRISIHDDEILIYASYADIDICINRYIRTK